ncbi:MAG: hypothetical protein ABIJ37_07190 [Pseudomonadota bacterium]
MNGQIYFHAFLDLSVTIKKKDVLIYQIWRVITTNFSKIFNEKKLEIHGKVNSNLQLAVEGNYLIAGNYFKMSSKDPDNAWKVAWAIKLAF